MTSERLYHKITGYVVKCFEIILNEYAAFQSNSIIRLTGGEKVANIKSAKKRIKTAKTRTLRNKSTKSRIKTETKKFLAFVEEKDFEKASEQLNKLSSYINKAAGKNVFHKKTAARKVSSLSRVLNTIK